MVDRMYLSVLSLVLALGVCLGVGAHHDGQHHHHSPDDVDVGSESMSRPQRSIFQAVGVRFRCSKNRDCYPPDLTNDTISSSLIRCDNSTGVCTCKDCFMLLRDKCVVADCHSYESTCTDDRSSQKNAFLLSLFLSGLGAANFYVGQEGLAWGQLALFVATVTAVLLIICVPLCVAANVVDLDGELSAATCCFVVFILSTLLFIALAVIAMVCWWAADLTIFVQNSRKDGNGCPLLADL